MLCPNCGRELTDHETICPDCGTPLSQEADTEQTASAADPVDTAPESSAPAPENGALPPEDAEATEEAPEEDAEVSPEEDPEEDPEEATEECTDTQSEPSEDDAQDAVSAPPKTKRSTLAIVLTAMPSADTPEMMLMALWLLREKRYRRAKKRDRFIVGLGYFLSSSSMCSI